MARIRTIKPEFFRHEALFEAEHKTGLPLRLAFAGMFTVADREGRFKWRPRQLKLDVLPFDELDFGAVMSALAEHGFIVRYSVDGEEYGAIPSWARHQVINNRESASVLPGQPDDACSTREARVPVVSSTGEAPADRAASTPLVRAPVEGNWKGREKEGNEEGEWTEGAKSRAPVSVADLVADGVSHQGTADLMEVRAIKGLRVLMRGDWIEFKRKAAATGRPLQDVVDHLIETGSHLEGFQPQHLAQHHQVVPTHMQSLYDSLSRNKALHGYTVHSDEHPSPVCTEAQEETSQ